MGIKIANIPVVSNVELRPQSTTINNLSENVYFERDVNSDKVHAVKRPGFTNETWTADAAYNNAVDVWSFDKTYLGEYVTLVRDATVGMKIYTLEYDESAGGIASSLRNTIAEVSGSNTAQWLAVKHYTNSGPVDIYVIDGADTTGPGNATYEVFIGGASTKITDADYPGALRGLVSLGGYLFGSDGVNIIHSDEDDAQTWAADAIISPSFGTRVHYLQKHNNHLVCFTDTHIEFFYNAGNATGSVLNTRKDRAIPIGVARIGLTSSVNRHTTFQRFTWGEDDCVVFPGRDAHGNTGLFLLRNFQVTKISNSAIDRLLRMDIDRTSAAPTVVQILPFHLAGVPHLWIYTQNTEVQNESTGYIIYNLELGVMSQWVFNASTAIDNDTFGQFTTLEWDSSGGASAASFPLYLIGPTTSAWKVDFEAYQDDSTYAIATEINFPKFLGTPGEEVKPKCGLRLSVVGDKNASAQSVDVSWSDDDYQSYSSATSLTIGPDQAIHQLGRFHERAFRLAQSATAAMRISEIKFMYEDDDV